MAEIDKTAEARRKAQRNGEEDPVIVAQRFLNIYRQMHIFSPERKAAFDKMLLELPADIRGLFSALPGGVLLQDYVDELAEKAGIERSVAPTSSAPSLPADDDEVSKAKILATALAEAQAQASVKMQTAAMSAPMVQAAPSQITLGNDFSAVLATTLADALQKNNAAQKDDLRNIIQSLGQTQLQMVKAMQDESAQQRMEMRNIYKTMSEAGANNVAAPVVQSNVSGNEETQNLIRVLTDTQQQLAQRISRVESLANTPQAAPNNDVASDQISKAILTSQENFTKTIAILSERQKNDTMEIAKMIGESQQKMMQFMEQNTSSNQPDGNDESQNMIKVLANVQQQLAQRISKVENATTFAPPPDVSEQAIERLSQAILSSREDFNKTITVLSERQKSDTMEIAKMIDESQQKMMNFMIQQNTSYQNSVNAATNNNNANNIQINTADYSQQFNQIMEKLASLQMGEMSENTPSGKNSRNGQKNPPSTTPMLNFDNEKIGAMLKDVVVTQSQLFREMAQAQTQELSSVISLALKESQKITTQSLIEALGRQPIVIQEPANVTYRPSNEEPEFRNEEILYSDTELNSTNAEVETNYDIASNYIESEILPAAEVMTTEPSPKKKKKKKKKKTFENAEITSNLEPIREESFEEEYVDATTSIETNPEETFAEESVIAQTDFEDFAQNESVNNYEAEANIAPKSSDALKALVGNAPIMPDIPDDIDLELDDVEEKEPFDFDDENIGSNWRGNIEETMPDIEAEIIPIDLDNNISADDWGFNSDTNAVEESQSDLSNADNYITDDEEWEWEYVEDDAETVAINYGNDNWLPILQESAIYSGEQYMHNPRNDVVTISASAQSSDGIYRFQITDTAKNDLEDDPYQKML